MTAAHARHVILIGMRGAGKTTVGRALADRLDREFVDCDARVVGARGLPVRELFEQFGEPQFREWERDVLVEVLRDERPLVIATGGGVILRIDNVADMRRGGVVVYLEADAETLARRIEADPATAGMRPSLTGLSPADEVGATLAIRARRYRDAASAVVPTAGRDIDAIVNDIVTEFERAESDPR